MPWWTPFEGVVVLMDDDNHFMQFGNQTYTALCLVNSNIALKTGAPRSIFDIY
jgi:hypothetical protein